MSEMGNYHINFQVLLDAIGLVQGTTLGILLLVLNRRKYRSTFFLGLFLIFYSLELATWISVNTQIAIDSPKFFLLPLNFSWLLFPLYFLYTQQVSILSEEKTKYWLLLPGILSLIFQIYIFFLPFESKEIIANSTWHTFVFWKLGNFYSWIIGGWNLWLLHKHSEEIQNTYSYLAFKELRWARNFLIYLLATSILSHLIAYVFTDFLKDNILFSIMDLIAIYWVSYFGIVQRNVRAVLTKNLSAEIPGNTFLDPKYASESVPEKLEDLMQKIDAHMQTEESFMNPELTIVELAEGLMVHPKLVSSAINTVKKQNFNSYVNQFRIKKAEALLRNNDDSYLSMEGICNKVGFKSKSAFYSAFKKETGTTPSKFKEKLVA
jgi:AraC-like DNA-binding protein